MSERKQWSVRQSSLMNRRTAFFATGAFGVGLDVPTVRGVYRFYERTLNLGQNFIPYDQYQQLQYTGKLPVFLSV